MLKKKCNCSSPSSAVSCILRTYVIPTLCLVTIPSKSHLFLTISIYLCFYSLIFSSFFQSWKFLSSRKTIWVLSVTLCATMYVLFFCFLLIVENMALSYRNLSAVSLKHECSDYLVFNILFW